MSCLFHGRTRPLLPLLAAIAAPFHVVGADASPAPSTPAVAAPADAAVWSRPIGDGARLRLIDLSLDVLTAAGGSTASDEELESLQGGGHDPNRRGITLQQVELSLVGAVDPYFTAEAHVILLTDAIELEEAFGRTSSLPAGLEVKAGRYLTEFGRINSRHPHAWAWMDQPVIATRLLGPDGMRGEGARLAWLTPLPWYSQVSVGAQNADDHGMVSFRGELGHGHEEDEDGPETTIGGRAPSEDLEVHGLDDLLWSARWENGLDGETTFATSGVSALFGPNASGVDGSTAIYGADLVVKWVPRGGRHGYPFVQVEIEAMLRDYQAEAGEFDPDETVVGDEVAVPEDDLRDWGFYAQALYGFTPGWAAGIRYEHATGDGESQGAFATRAEDPLRDDRQRVSPLLAWMPSHFSRLRLQYAYDRFDHPTEDDEDDAHSLWLGVEVMIGAHPAHRL